MDGVSAPSVRRNGVKYAQGALSFSYRAFKTLMTFPKAVNHRFGFAFVAVAIIAAKIIHVIARERALLRRELVGWMLSFFMQDFVLLLVQRFLAEWSYSSPYSNRFSLARMVGRLVYGTIGLFSAIISVVNITFFLHTHSEVRWRDVAFASDSGSRGVLLSGLATLLLVLLALTCTAGFLQNNFFVAFGGALDAVRWPFQAWSQYRQRSTDSNYLLRPDEKHIEAQTLSREYGGGAVESRFWRLVWTVFIILQFIFYALRPHEGALVFISWTTPIIPFVDFKESASTLQDIRPFHGVGIKFDWDDKTALDEPVQYDWLPQENVLKGFEDWYEEGRQHYNAKSDPLFISNLDQDVLPQLADVLSTVSIKHVVLLVLESTRKDLFPIKKDGLIWKRFEEAASDHVLSNESIARLETLTPFANHLTGDFEDGFSHEGKYSTPRGGLNFKDANTASTYTRKSMIGTMCGIWPLVADFNKEYLHHIYQPCIPQILEAFSYLDQNSTESGWRSQYMQSVTLTYDHADVSTEQYGFPSDNIIGARYLRSNSAKFGKVDLPDINYFGMAEAPLEDYFHDAFQSAKNNSERLFLTHLTSTTHHPYAMPAEEEYVPLATGKWDDLSHYVNSIGYDDRWLGKILNVLDEENVANETLVIITGDHGISIPENSKPASYYNPNVGCNHIPLVFSHPSLPPIDVTDSVSNMEILPTLLDLLRETGSLSSAANKAAGDLLDNYEGQSLIRNLRHTPASSPLTDEELRNWQFIVMNPGRAMLGIRDRRRKNWRIVVPVIHDVEWQFTDLEVDPTDTDSIQGFDFAGFLRKIQKRHGKEAAYWAEEAAFMARWWVEENNKRWEYGPYAAQPSS